MSATPAENSQAIEPANEQAGNSVQKRSDAVVAGALPNGPTVTPTPLASVLREEIIPPAANTQQAPIAAGDRTDATLEATDEDSEARKEHAAAFLATLNAIVSDKLPATSNKSMSTGQPTILARLVNLSRKLSELDDAQGLYQQADFAAKLLKASDANAQTVNDIIDDIDFSTSKNSPIYSVMRGLAKSVGYQFFLLLVLVIASSTPSIYVAVTNPTETPAVLAAAWDHSLRLLGHPFVIAIIFGVFGSVVSILLRLSEFESATRKSRQFLVMTGAMLPLVGAIFGAVTCALFSSGIVNFQFANPAATVKGIESPYFYVVIGFLSGFSERFTRGLLGRAENAVTGTAENSPATNGKPAVTK
jgi:hypothetical protein